MLPAGLITLAVGAIGILGAASLPRLAAYATLMSMGTVFTALSGFTPLSTTAALYYMIHSTLAGAALFLIADLVQTRAPGSRLPAGLAALFFAVAIATAGLPPLSGFPAKIMVLMALPGWPVWTVVLGGTFLALLGFSRAGSAMFWKPQGQAAALPAAQAFGPATLLAALVALTLFAGPVTGWLQDTALSLHNPAPYILAHDLPGGA
ncbi:hypothetical protein MASR1M32_39420 [Rhodobacter sp.]